MNPQAVYEELKKQIQKWTSFLSIPHPEKRNFFIHQKILGQLQGLGVAAQEDVNHLKKRIKRLEAMIERYEQTHAPTQSSTKLKKKLKPSALHPSATVKTE